jgi:hypothetical protein
MQTVLLQFYSFQYTNRQYFLVLLALCPINCFLQTHKATCDVGTPMVKQMFMLVVHVTDRGAAVNSTSAAM